MKVAYASSIALILVVGSFNASLLGQDEPAITVVNFHNFVDSVSKFHPEKSIKELSIERSATAIKKVGKLSDPELSFSREYIDLSKDRMQTSSLTPMWGIELKQMFPWPGTLDSERKSTTDSLNKAKEEGKISSLIRIIEAKNLYISLITAKRILDLEKESLAIVGTIFQSASSRLKYGIGSHHEVIQTQNEKTILELNILAEETTLENRKDYAAQMMGKEDATKLSFDFSFPKEDSNKDITTNQDLGRNRLESIKNESESKLETERKKTLPKFMLAASYMKDDSGMNQASIMAGLSIPVFSNGTRNAVNDEVRFVAAQAAEELSWHEKKKKLALIQLERRRSVIKSQLQSLEKEVVPNAKQHLKSLLSEYGQGKAIFNSINQARRALLNYQKSKVMLDSALFAAIFSRDKIQAGLLEGELDQAIPQISLLDMSSSNPMEEEVTGRGMQKQKDRNKKIPEQQEPEESPSNPMGGM